MPGKVRYAKGHRGFSGRSVRRGTGPGAASPAVSSPRQAGRPAGTVRKPADWGGDGHEGGGPADDPKRNGGMRYFREIDMADREEREGMGLTRRKYSWRTITGPTPDVKYGDRKAAKAYLDQINAAIDRGGWTSSEAAGLYEARRVWKARAAGMDARYNLVGNRQGGLTAAEARIVRQEQIILDMQTIAAGGTIGE